ncbi:AMIN-like domain-containing (lipo)protein [Rhodococcus sp. 24CO]|uniref:AMIN-like domain-containing (lipo)protein n=1 Tax=Rhodococcus sp. 24CO TaxID=3117460 RepID=UPI003D342D83
MRIGSPAPDERPSLVVPGTETNAPLPIAEVTAVAVDHLHDRSRVTYHLSGTGTVTWKVEYVSEAIRGGDNHVVDVNGSSILQVDIVGVTALQQFPPIETYGGTISSVETALVSRDIVQSFVGTAAGRPEFQATGTESPGHIVVDVFYAPA